MASGNAGLPTRFRYRLSPVNMRRGMWVVAFSLAALMALGSFASESLAETLLEDLQRQPAWALSLALIGIVTLAVLIFRIMRLAGKAYLEIDSEGIRCSPHKHHGPRHWLRHDWRLPWSAIERAVVSRPGPKSQHVQGWINTTLSLFTTQGRYDMALLLWDPVDDPLPRPDLMAFRPARPLHALTESHPLLRHFEQRGIPVAYEQLGFRGRWGIGAPPDDRPSAQGDEAPVDLLAHRSLIFMLALMGLVGLAAALHFTVLPPIRALWAPHVGMLALTGSVIFAAGAILAGSAPVRERTVVALMLGALVGLLGHPLSVRFQSLSGPEPRVADYILETSGRFQPVDENLPALDLTGLDIPEYWQSLSDGGLHPFHLQKVGEERFILRMGPLFERTRAFYSNRESQ